MHTCFICRILNNTPQFFAAFSQIALESKNVPSCTNFKVNFITSEIQCVTEPHVPIDGDIDDENDRLTPIQVATKEYKNRMLIATQEYERSLLENPLKPQTRAQVDNNGYM